MGYIGKEVQPRWRGKLAEKLRTDPDLRLLMVELSLGMRTYLNDELQRGFDQAGGVQEGWDYSDLPEALTGLELQSLIKDHVGIAQQYPEAAKGTPYWEVASSTEQHGADFDEKKPALFCEIPLTNGFVVKYGRPSDFTAQEIAALIARQVESYVLGGGLGDTQPQRDGEIYRQFIAMLSKVNEGDLFFMTKKWEGGRLIIANGGKISIGSSSKSLAELNAHPEESHLSTVSSVEIKNLPPEYQHVPIKQIATIGRFFGARPDHLAVLGYDKVPMLSSLRIMEAWAFSLAAFNAQAAPEDQIKYVLFDTEVEGIWKYLRRCGAHPLAEMTPDDISQASIRASAAEHPVLKLHYRDGMQLYVGILAVDDFLAGVKPYMKRSGVPYRPEETLQ